jgi:hypothetical protein
MSIFACVMNEGTICLQDFRDLLPHNISYFKNILCQEGGGRGGVKKFPLLQKYNN